MGKALLLASDPGLALGASARFQPFGSADMQANTNEVQMQMTARIAGTLSMLAAQVDATGTGRSVKTRKNTANGNQTLSPTDSTAGIFEDNTNTDTVASTDRINFMTACSTGTPVYYWMRQVFSATTGHAAYFNCVSAISYTTDSVSTFAPLAGQHTNQTTEANAQVKIRAPGTLQNSQVYVSANSRATGCILYSRINGSRGTIAITIGAGLTGLFEDTTHTDTLVDGDLVDWELVTSTGGGTLTVQRLSSAVVATSGNANDIFASGASGGTTRAASGTPTYYYIAGNSASPGSEALAKVQHGFQATLSKMRLYVSANTYASDATAVLRVNGADTALTFPITAATTGWFEDTTHSVTVAATDDVCWSITGGTSGSITLRTFGLTELDGVPPPVVVPPVDASGGVSIGASYVRRPFHRPLRAPYANAPDASGLAGANANSAGMWWAGTDYWLDLANNYGMNNGAPITPAGVITDTHAQTINAPATTGVYSAFAANVLTRTDLGLQTVPTRTNLLLQSQTFDNASWTKGLTTVSANSLTAPDGTLTADTLIESVSGSSKHEIYQSVTKAVSAIQYAVSVFAKANTRTAIQLGVGSDASNEATAVFDLSAGTVGSVANTGTWGSATAGIVAIGNGWYFCYVVSTSNTATTVFPVVRLWNGGNSYVGDGTSGLYLWQAQFEVGAFASPPILTTAASVTVNGNQQVIDLTGRLGTGVAGLVQIELKSLSSSNINVFAGPANGNDRMTIDLSGTTLIVYMYNATVLQAAVSLPGTVSIGINTVAFAFSENFVTGRLVGASAATADTSASYPLTNNNNFALGGAGYTAAGNSYLFTRKLALSFGPQSQATFDAMYQRAVLAVAA